MKESILGNLLRVLPKNFLSYWVGKLVHLRLPAPLSTWSVRWFVRRYRINMEEAEYGIEHYQSIGELFTRRLKPNARPIGEGFVHPADGVLSILGRIYEGQLIQAKGIKYKIADFVGSYFESREYEGGAFLTYYLCPTDYHRVHSPVDGEIRSCVHIPGRLWPVNPWSVNHISQVFAVNERVVVEILDGPHRILVVFVGATNVGKMTMSFDEKIVTNQGSWKSPLHKIYKRRIPIHRGQELGIFHMGSTVIVLLPPNYLDRLPPPGPHKVKMGQPLSSL